MGLYCKALYRVAGESMKNHGFGVEVACRAHFGILPGKPKG